MSGGDVWRVVGPSPVGFAGPGRPLSRFVGREREHAFLDDRLGQLREGRGHVVGLIGEPGGGKSRLLHEFRASVARAGVAFAGGRCLSYAAGVPYMPVLDLLRRAWGLDEADPPAAVVERVREQLQQAELEAREHAPYLLRLLGIADEAEELARLTPEAIKTRTFDALRRLLLRRPLVLAVEDLHWIDRTSEEFLASVVDSVPGAPVLAIMTYRPGYRPPWIDRSYVTQLALAPLSRADSRAVVRSVAAALPEAVVDEIVARGEGNPFLLEELAWGVVQPGAGTVSRVPQTIREALMARIDRLPPDRQRLLETAAVLGREVPSAILEWIAGEAAADAPARARSADVTASLRELVSLEFLHEQATASGRLYVFKHALTQEVAYGRVEDGPRQALHAAAGRALETMHAGRTDEVLPQLAHHWSRAGDAPRAVTYLQRFADRAAAGYALVEVVGALQEALGHAERLPEGPERETGVISVLVRIGIPLVLLGRLVEGRDLFLRYRDRVDRLDDPALGGPFYLNLAAFADHHGEREPAVSHARRSIAHAERCGDRGTVGKAHVILAHSTMWAGELAASVEHARSARACLDAPADSWWRGMAFWISAFSRVLQGDLAGALRDARELAELGDATGDLRLRTYALCIAAAVAAARADAATAVEAARRAVDIATDPLARLVAVGYLADALLASAEHEEAIRVLQDAMELLRQVPMPQLQGWNLARLSEAERGRGHASRARDLALEAASFAEAVDFRYGIGLARQALGRARLAEGAADEAAAALSDAAATFEAIGASYDLARTLVDAAEAARARQRRGEAGAALRRAREGFAALDVPAWVRKVDERLEAHDPAPGGEAYRLGYVDRPGGPG